MTANQIAFANVQESKRHNLATEQEANRHNTVTEAQSDYINAATASHYQSQDAINAEHYGRMDSENARSHLMNESIQQAQLEETKRHNQVVETETSQHNRNVESLTEAENETRKQEATTNRINAYTRRDEQVEIERHNKATEQKIQPEIDKLVAETALTSEKLYGEELDNSTRGLKNILTLNELTAHTEELKASAKAYQAKVGVEESQTKLNEIDSKTRNIQNILDVVDSASQAYLNVKRGLESKAKSFQNIVNSISRVLPFATK